MKVITPVVNNPVFIEIQYLTLKKYLKNDFEFIIFNDAKDFPDYTNGGDITLKNKIIEKCKELNIKCININNNHHRYNLSGSIRHTEALNLIVQYQLANPDKYLILDSDMFLIDYLDINKYSNYKSAIVLQKRLNNKINYLWSGLSYFDMEKINNFELLDWSITEYSDSGGLTEKWLKTQLNKGEELPLTEELRWNKEINYNTKNIYLIKHLWSLTWDVTELPENLKKNEKLVSFLLNDPRNKNEKYFCEIYDKIFLHYRGGCNWLNEGMDFHIKQTNILKEVLL